MSKERKSLILTSILLLFSLVLIVPPADATHINYIVDSYDDTTEWGDGTTDVSGNSLDAWSYVDNTDANYRAIGARFDNIPIDQGEQVENAFIEFYITAVNDDANFILYAHDIDDSPDFNILPQILDNTYRPKTTAHNARSADGLIGNSWENGDNIAHIIQEIVDRPGWVSGNAITLILVPKTDGTKQLTFRSYDFSPALASRLWLHWQPTIENTQYPTIAVPHSVIHIDQTLQSHGQEATDITAKITFSENVFLMNEYPENDITIENLLDDDQVHAEWYVGMPDETGSLTFFVEWEFIHEDYHYELSDNFEIQVAYFETQSTGAIGELEKDFVILFLVFLNVLMIIIRRMPYLQIFIALSSSMVGALLNGTSVFPWLNLLLITTAIYSIINTYQSVNE